MMKTNNDLAIPIMLEWQFQKLLAKIYGVIDILKYFCGTSCAYDADSTIAQYAPEDALIYFDGFDFIEVHLQRTPADEADLDDDAVIGDSKLICPASQCRCDE